MAGQARRKKRKETDLGKFQATSLFFLLACTACGFFVARSEQTDQVNLIKITTTQEDFYKQPPLEGEHYKQAQVPSGNEGRDDKGQKAGLGGQGREEITVNNREANDYHKSIKPEMMIYGLRALETTSPATSGWRQERHRPLIDLDYNINHHVLRLDKKVATSDHEEGDERERVGNVNVDVRGSRRREKRNGARKRQTTGDDHRLLQTNQTSEIQAGDQEAEEVEVRGTTRTRPPPSLGPSSSSSSSSSRLLVNMSNSQRDLEGPVAGLKCRLEKDLYLDFEEYRHSTCASCYNQFPRDLFKRKLLYSKEARIWLYDNQSNRTLLPNETQLIRRTFQDEAAYDKWRACCQMAVECCLAHSSELPSTKNSLGQLIDDPNRSECPATWDGLACWPSSPGGQLAWRECPRHVYFLSFEPACTGHVAKQCFSNGSWFIRNGHEWSDYSHCVPMAIYVRRMLFSVAWHIISVLVITPALLTINKFSGRGGNKRVKILRNLLFWLLISSCIQAAKNSGIVSGLFEPGRPNPGSGPGSSGGAAASGGRNRDRIGSGGPETEPNLIKSSNFSTNQNNDNKNTHNPLDRHVRRTQSDRSFRPPEHLADEQDNSIKVIPNQQQQTDAIRLNDATHFNDTVAGAVSGDQSDRLSSTRLATGDQLDAAQDQADSSVASLAGGRCKRQAPAKTDGRRTRSSALVIFFCWSLVVAERIARLMGYSWMFTGAIYLCSALHFAPAEPPAQAIRWLMFLTNAFPIVIALVYVTSRTIVEPSPLNIIFQVPYYKLLGDKDSLDYLWSTQLDCWLNQPKNERIEDIADLPNLILVCLNVSLFIITLIILCRINRPGSTRPDMSPLTYFKAAGTLVVLYGGHYALLAYRPNAESCYYDIIMAYAFLFVDGIQGIAVSYVFCYRTQEGKEIIWKYWRNKHEHIPFKWCKWLYCRNVHKLNVDNGHQTSATAGAQSRCNHHSFRSNNSTCNGHNETVTELINISDTPVTSNNKF